MAESDSERSQTPLTTEQQILSGCAVRAERALSLLVEAMRGTPCTDSAVKASGEPDKCPECGWFKGLHNAGCSRMNEGRAAAEVPR